MIHDFSKSGRLTQTFHLLIIALLLFTWGCATTSSPSGQTTPVKQEQKVREKPSHTKREHRSADYVVLIAKAQDTYESLAGSYLGDVTLAYLIAEANNNNPIVAGKEVVIPLQPVNPGGLYPDGYQTVPVLSYHQLSHKPNPNSMFVSEAAFDQQMAYLKNNGFNVITLKQFLDFIESRRRPPKKSVVITFDDGWKSTKTMAYPILKKYGFTAVLFVYTDMIKSKQNSVALSWEEVRQLKDSGVFELGAHSITHSDLSKVSDEQLHRELHEAQRIIAAKTGSTPVAFAYPYGVFNDKIVAAVKKSDYKAAFSVIRGGNAFFYSPFALNRSMIKGEKLDDFKKRLEIFRQDSP